MTYEPSSHPWEQKIAVFCGVSMGQVHISLLAVAGPRFFIGKPMSYVSSSELRLEKRTTQK